MRELDCSDMATALASVGSISGLSTEDLVGRLRAIRLSTKELDEKPLDELVVDKTFGSVDSLPVPDSVCWFHASRVPKGTTFEEGLLPTPTIWESVEAELRDIADHVGLCPNGEWANLPRGGHEVFRLNQKRARDPFDKGPHGWLVRETIIHPDGLPIPDYTESSELAAEICRSVGENIGAALLEEYNKERRRVIVKFRSRLVIRRTMEFAVNYLHARLMGQPLNAACALGFDGGGVAITKLDILDVEWIT